MNFDRRRFLDKGVRKRKNEVPVCNGPVESGYPCWFCGLGLLIWRHSRFFDPKLLFTVLRMAFNSAQF